MHPLVACLPYPLARDLLRHPDAHPGGRELRFAAVALFVDVAGFTPLSAALGARGRAGTEELTRLLNTHFGALIALSELYGGRAMQFGGDSFTALFPYTARRRPAVVRRALACALAIQARVPQEIGMASSAGPFRLTLRAGLAGGRVLCLTAGDPAGALIYILAGALLERAARAEQQAPPGAVVVAGELLDGMSAVAHVAAGAGYARVTGLGRPVRTAPLPPLPALPPQRGATLAAFVHPAIAARLAAGRQGFVDEHRIVTVLFVSFSGFHYDQDRQVGARLRAYLGAVLAVVARYAGYLKEVEIGDKGSKYIVLFGAPLAHEDDAARALRCALDLRGLDGRAVGIGVNTGLVYCGLVGGPTRQEYTAIGDGVNVAARLMEGAAAGQILVGESTQRAAGSRFAWASLAPLQVKGKAAPVAVAALLGLRAAQALCLPEPPAQLPLIGRTAELARVAALLDQVLAGHGQILGITAEAGLGKSRLGAAVIRLATGRGLAATGGACQSYGTASPYLVWQGIWRSFFGLDPTRQAAQQIAHLETQIRASDPDLVARVPLLGAVLNLPIPDTPVTQVLDAELRKASLEALLISCLRARGGGGAPASPLLIVLEDCHWLDPLSQDLLAAVGRVIGDLPVLLVLLYRPAEGDRGWAARLARLAYFHELRLAEFTPQEAARLIALKLGSMGAPGTAVPAALTARITARAQGNPFYIEELINLLRDRGIDPADPQALVALDVPDSLQQLLTSRLDALAEGERLAVKVASVIGRAFRAAWLWEVAPEIGPAAVVQRYLDTLSRLDITPLDRPAPELEYLFKHILTRDVAYDSLTYATRAQLHGAVAAYIERTYAPEIDRWLDLLAYHYGCSADAAKQREYFRRAGAAAQAAYANEVAIAYYERLLPFLPAPEQIPVLLQLGQMRQLLGQWPAAEAVYRQGLRLVETAGDPALQGTCQVYLGDLLRLQGRHAEALVYLDRARDAALARQDSRGSIDAVRHAGVVYFDQGSYAEARACFTRALAWAQALADAPETSSRLLKSLADVYAVQGDYAAALGYYEQALAISRARGDLLTEGRTTGSIGMIHLERSAYGAAGACFARWLQIAEAIGDRLGVCRAIALIGRVHIEQGENLQALARYQQWLQLALESGNQRDASYAVGNIGTVYGELGDFPRAFRCQEYKLAIAFAVSDRPSMATCLENMAAARVRQGQYGAAAPLSARAVALCRALNTRYILCYALYTNADLAVRQQHYRAAQAVNADALALAAAAGIQEIAFKARLLAVRLSVLLGQAARPAAVATLRQMLAAATARDERAALYYEWARLDPTEDEPRQAAADLYRTLYAETFNSAYRACYAELTGAPLPDPPPLPELPALLTREAVALDVLLARVDALLAELGAERAPSC